MAKQTDPVINKHPTTTAEIHQVRVALTAREQALIAEGQRNFEAARKGMPPPRALSEHEIRVRDHIKNLLNGATPQHLIGPVDASRDEQIRAELEAIRLADRYWANQYEDARDREAQQYADQHDKEWRALCREIVLTAVRLESLESRARDLLEPIRGALDVKIAMAMATTIGSGFSMLGIGDPLSEMKNEALKQGIVTNAEIRKAQNANAN
ncbi:hypothetical protein [Bradyrhizobium sp. USDA 4473]